MREDCTCQHSWYWARMVYTMQVWKKAGWPLGGGVSKGTFVQLETPKSRSLWFLAEGALKDGRLEARVLSDDFMVMERLLR